MTKNIFKLRHNLRWGALPIDCSFTGNQFLISRNQLFFRLLHDKLAMLPLILEEKSSPPSLDRYFQRSFLSEPIMVIRTFRVELQNGDVHDRRTGDHHHGN